MAQDPYKYFRLEARDLLDQFAKGILELERGEGGNAVIPRLLRLAHTLKGAARVVKQPEIADRAHAIEDVLSPFRESADGVAREQLDTILGQLDEIGGRVRALTPVEDAEMPAQSKSTSNEGFRTVRVDVAEMDVVLAGVSETHSLLNGLRAAASALEQARRMADILQAQFVPQGATRQDRQIRGDADRLLSMTEEFRRRFGGFERILGSAIDQMDSELRQLRDSAEQLRLVSVGTLFTALERTARDTAQALSKHVVFEGKGGAIRLDSHILEVVQGALMQLVRNAVAHGIEPGSERRAAGKQETGRVTVDIRRLGRRIAFECRDDGRGVDLDAVRRVAQQRGLLGSEAKRFDANDLMRALLRGGISTSNTITEVSGRGIGLDVVREAAERLGGEVVVRSDAGAGTVFQLVVPLSLASLDALIVEASGTAIGIPLDAVRSSLRIAAKDISRTPAGATVLYDEKVIPFIPLSKALGGASQPVSRNWTAVVVAGAGGMAAIGVDRLLDTARIVVRPLPDHTPASAIVAGVLLDAEGNPQLVFDPDGLVAAAHGGDIAELETKAPGRPVLVIDDSLTTRMLEQSILESAGYDVDVAQSGEEAIEILRRKRYALFLVDVDMPGMDGFTFIERIRSDSACHEIPAILVTSRSSPEDRQRGRDVGAQGYIVKGEFDQVKLLTMINSLTA
jgi:two-component system chemotaxis sensor kinase CheA